MNSSFLNELYNSYQNNYEIKESTRERHINERENVNKDRDTAMGKACGELYQTLVSDGLLEKMKDRANDGYSDYLLFSVSLDHGMDEFASHDAGKPYVFTEYNGKTYKFTYRSLFWHREWKNHFHPFNLSYRWNRANTLLYVYISWNKH